MWPPALLAGQPRALQIAVPVIGPVVTGAIGGVLLGVTKPGYLIWTLVMILGGIASGMEHDTPRGGALRGLFGGALFAATILGVHELIGNDAKATLPHPGSVLIVVFAVISAVLGVLGSRLRGRFAPAPAP
jgi:hypothetical protein